MYIIGGYSFNRVIQDLYCYNFSMLFNYCFKITIYSYSIAENVWYKMFEHNILTNRSSHTSCVINNKIYCYGGKKCQLVELDLNTYEIKEIEIENPPLTRYFHNSFVWKGNLYVIFGIRDSNLHDMIKFKFNTDQEVSYRIKSDILMNSSVMSDYTIIVENTKIHCHRVILYLGCEYFRALFDSNMKESQSQSMVIENYNYSTIYSIIEFIYKGYTNITEKNALSILLCSDEFLLKELKMNCEKFISKRIASLSKEKLKEVINVAYICNCEELWKSCEYFINNDKDNLKELLNEDIEKWTI